MRSTSSHPRALLVCVLAGGSLLACDDSPSELELRPITSGSVSGLSFTVTGGTVFQATVDGPIYADSRSGRIVFDEDPGGLGMSDPDQLQLRTQFALAEGGSIRIAAFGEAGDELGSDLRVVITRGDESIDYGLWLGGALFADSAFTPPPAVLSAEHWIVTEFYAQDVPGYGAGQSGITMWELNDVAPALGTDVLGCDPIGPAIQPVALDGDRVGLEIRSGWIVAFDVVDEIVGPCR